MAGQDGQDDTRFATTFRGFPAMSAAPSPTVPALVILHHTDLSRIGEMAFLAGPGQAAVRVCRTEPAFQTPGGELDRPLDDPWLSRKAVALKTLAGGGVQLESEAERIGLRVDGEAPSGPVQLTQEQLERGVTLELGERVLLLLHQHTRDARPPPVDGLVGNSDAIWDVVRQIDDASRVDVPVLIRGETGVGKELVAAAIHAKSARAAQPWICVNVAAIPSTTAASALFGHARGSFTGADRAHDGYFARADGGTLFLDEIGDASPDVQAMLLRVLESGELQAVGSRTIHRVDVRLISATDADLEADGPGGFRAPLLYRLASYEIRVPPLRERREDIGLLFLRFLREQLEELGDTSALRTRPRETPLWIPPRLLARIVAAPWPGNVRQLRTFARRLAIDNRSREVVRLDPALEAQLAVAAPAADKVAPARSPRPTDDDIAAALRAHRWELKAAAGALGISRQTLYTRIKKSRTLRLAGDIPDAELTACHEACEGDVGAMSQVLRVSARAIAARLRDLGDVGR